MSIETDDDTVQLWDPDEVSTHVVVRWLQRTRILLSPEHHRAHHESDNRRYAFLNGMTDPLLDRVARRFYPAGYVATTNAHSEAYYRSGR